MHVHPGVTWDGPIRDAARGVVWNDWVTPEQLDRMLGELEFCRDGVEISRRWTGT